HQNSPFHRSRDPSGAIASETELPPLDFGQKRRVPITPTPNMKVPAIPTRATFVALLRRSSASRRLAHVALSGVCAHVPWGLSLRNRSASLLADEAFEAKPIQVPRLAAVSSPPPMSKTVLVDE